ncbi:hypothetical protein N9B31_09000 [Mariniblastus sp.]|nr:hypothetical protein [Mariniblastus sp.]
MSCPTVEAQRPSFSTAALPQQPGGTNPALSQPQINNFPIPSNFGQPSAFPIQQTPPPTSPPFVNPQTTSPPPNLTFPTFDQSGGQNLQGQPQLGQPQLGQPMFGQPNQMAPGGYQPQQSWQQDPWTSFTDEFLPKVFEHPRAWTVYIPGGSGNELNINDIGLATTINIPKFLNGPSPLKISPGFIFNFWNGPSTPTFDLPAQAYSSYLAFDHITDPSKRSGLETNFTVGFYSDYKNTSSDGLRFTGKLLGWSRLNEYTVAKFGVEYLDRLDIKLLPAFGLYMNPNPDMKLDLYFPKTKLAHRLPRINNYDAWGYIGAELGGGSWAIDRANGMKDQADVNDVRAFIGIEWMGNAQVTGFLDLGYVFNREIVYRSSTPNLDLSDAMMLRFGFAF